MKKSLVALATLAATASFAQVTLTGNLDVAYGTVSPAGADSAQTVSPRDIASTTSVLNVMAVENVGGGTTVTAKYGFDPRLTVRENGGLVRDEAFIGIAGGMGNIRLGSPNSIGLGAHGVANPLGTGIGGGYAYNINGYTSSIRYDRSVRYDSPVIAGFTVSVLKAMGAGADITQTSSAAANTIVAAGRQVTELGVSYSNGPLNVAVANIKRQAYLAEADRSSTNVSANYNLGATTLYLGTTSGKLLSDATAQATQKGISYGVKHSMGNIDLIANISTRKDSNQAKQQKVTGLRADYNLSKTAAVYVGYSNFAANVTTDDQKVTSIGLRKSF